MRNEDKRCVKPGDRVFFYTDPSSVGTLVDINFSFQLGAYICEVCWDIGETTYLPGDLLVVVTPLEELALIKNDS